MDGTAPYCSSLTREQFLFYEMRITARLMQEGLSDEDIIAKVTEENLFQYPTEKSLSGMARACIKRLRAMDNEQLIKAIAVEKSDVGKQLCLYALMKQSRLIWEFMVTVIGEKYLVGDFSFGKLDLNSFFSRLQEQSPVVSKWNESTIKRIKQVIAKVLAENEYLDNIHSDHINPVFLTPILETAIRQAGDTIILPAFNRLDR